MINRGVRVGEMAPYKSTSFPDMLEMAHIFFDALYDQFKAPCQVVLLFRKFCIFQSFLGQKRPINGWTCHNLHTVTEIDQTWHG